MRRGPPPQGRRRLPHGLYAAEAKAAYGFDESEKHQCAHGERGAGTDVNAAVHTGEQAGRGDGGESAQQHDVEGTRQ